MRKLLVAALVIVGSTTMAFGQSASYSWEWDGVAGDTVELAAGEEAVINVFITIDALFAGWHYDLNAAYTPPGTPNFEMTDLWVMPEAYRYDGLVEPDINDYRSFADINEQAADVYWLDPGMYLIEELTITGSAASAGEISFDPTPGTGYNVLYKDPLDGIIHVPGVTIPGSLFVTPEPATLSLLALGGLALLRRRR